MKEATKIFKSVKNSTIAKTVMGRIKEALMNKTLKPGDRLPTEAELCESMEVGKSSVREAIKMLGVLGVVETRQGDGTYISTAISENSINPLVYQLLIDYGSNGDIMELRSMFEPAYTLLALKNATPFDIDRMAAACQDFKAKVKNQEQRAEDDLQFHQAMLEATHNPFVIRIGLTVMQLFRASIGDSMREIPQQALSDHSKILEAFIHKDQAALLKAIDHSFEGWRSMINQT